MLNSDTSRERIIIDPGAQKVLTDWFAILSEHENRPEGRRINGRAWRAELRRMNLPFDVMMCEGYSELRNKLSACISLRPVDQLALAVFVSVAVHINVGKNDKSFAAQLGEKINESPCLTPLRFQRLQQAASPDVFCLQLIRAVKLCGTEGVNVVSLADGIFLWMREWQNRQDDRPEASDPFIRNRIRWANEYLSGSR